MPDNPPAPQPAPAPDPNKAKTQPPDSGVNQAYAASLTRVENLARAALKPDRVAPLSADGSDITQAFLDGCITEVTAVRKLLGIAGQQTTDKEDATDAGHSLEEKLIQAIQQIQARARQKYGATGSTLKDYHVGDRLGGNRSGLEQASQDILTKLESDTLPGITAAKITDLSTLRQQYVDSELDQTSTGGDAAAKRRMAKTRLDALVDKRQKIQFAADAIWPWHDDANVGIRKEFELPATRPYAA
jgi:hypothetical protein